MGQTFTCLNYHLVFSTKHRAAMIVPAVQDRLYGYIGGILREQRGQLRAAGGTADHIHLLVTLHQDGAIAGTVRDIKANSSKWIHETFPAMPAFAWQDGYAAFTVSLSGVPRVRDYIAAQGQHHRQTSFQEELVRFLKRHGIPYDPEHIWA